MATGYFDDSSPLRALVGHRLTGLSGPRALLMMAAHPLAFAGFFAHTGALADPYARLERTARVLDAIAFGTREEADRLTRRVRAVHARVRGTLEETAGRFPAGTPYRADDPDLLMWVLFTLVDSAGVVYHKYVGQLSAAEQDELWADYRIVGRLFGLRERDMPDDLDAYRDQMLGGDSLYVSGWARERARAIVLEPPVPLAARPLLETVNFVTIALLPDRIRREYGFAPLPPVFLRRALVAGGAEYVKRVLVPLLPDRLRLVPAARVA
jgi:uncharacterized protein (DUF2236 family)